MKAKKWLVIWCDFPFRFFESKCTKRCFGMLSIYRVTAVLGTVWATGIRCRGSVLKYGPVNRKLGGGTTYDGSGKYGIRGDHRRWAPNLSWGDPAQICHRKSHGSWDPSSDEKLGQWGCMCRVGFPEGMACAPWMGVWGTACGSGWTEGWVKAEWQRWG